MDNSGVSDLTNQLLDNKNQKLVSKDDIREERPKSTESRKAIAPNNRKFIFRRGEEQIELDDDFEIEMMADKRLVKMTLKELKEKAAGDVAIKNRMHTLAEEKKRIQSTFRQFAEMSKKDPLGALEFISNQAKEADGEFEYNSYLEKLAEQAEKLGQMDEKDRKAWELEKKLAKAETDLSHKQREANVVLRKQEILADYPEIGDSDFGSMVDAVLNSEDLMQGLENEEDVMNKVEELVQETLTQRDIMQVIREINSDYLNDNNLIFSLSDQLKQNPDLDEEDIRDIIGELIHPREEREEMMVPVQSNERAHAARVLSEKSRQSGIQRSNKPVSDFDRLATQLKNNYEKNKKTPLYMR